MMLSVLRFTGVIYPNGVSKERLFNTFFTYRDFACGQAEYEHDLETIVIEERAGAPICGWHRDVDGELVVDVDRLQLVDPKHRVIMTETWFTFATHPDHSPVIFVSYAHEDYRHARRLANAFQKAGLLPWLDKDRLLPGQRWEPAVTSAIERSDRVVLILSRNSVNKKGFFHREIRLALEVVQRLPERAVFLIPIRIEECELPHTDLGHFQRVDLFPESEWLSGVQRIVSSCRGEPT